MKETDIKQTLSDLRHNRFGRRLTQKEENTLKYEFDTFYKNYMDDYSIGDRSTYDKVLHLEIYQDDGYYYLVIFTNKYYYFQLDGFSDLIGEIRKWVKKIK